LFAKLPVPTSEQEWFQSTLIKDLYKNCKIHTISSVNTPTLERLLIVGKEQSDNKICF